MMNALTFHQSTQVSWRLPCGLRIQSTTSVPIQIKPYMLILRQGALDNDQARDRTVYSPFLRIQSKTENGLQFNIDASYQFGQAAENVSHSA